MSNPTLTWTSTAERTITIAGTNATIAELLAAINTAIVNDSTLWQVSDYNSGNGTLEIKRKGTVSGAQGTCRLLVFGGQVPNSGALTSPAPTAAATSLYAGGTVDANTTGPSASYASAAPYNTTFIRGNLVCTNSDLSAAGGSKVSLIESVDGIAICLRSTSVCATIIFGNLIEDAASGGLYWVCFTSGGAFSTTGTDNSFNSPGGNNGAVSICYTSGAFHGNYWNTVTASCRATGRLISYVTGTSNPILGTSGGPAALLPIPLGDATLSSGAPIGFLGFLRQIRLGPNAQHLQTVRNNSVVQAIYFGSVVAVTQFTGAWFDQTA